MKKVKIEKQEMKYFDDVKVGQELYSIVYGKGEVIMVLEQEARVDGFLAFQVQFSKHKTVHYTLDGFPNWCAKSGCEQTVFYTEDVDFSEMDFEPIVEIPKKKKVMKYKDKDKLEMRCPSGAWRNTNDCPDSIVKKLLKGAKYHLFRKAKKQK